MQLYLVRNINYYVTNATRCCLKCTVQIHSHCTNQLGQYQATDCTINKTSYFHISCNNLKIGKPFRPTGGFRKNGVIISEHFQ